MTSRPGRFFAALAANRERELLSGLQIKGSGQVAGANGRSLGVHQDADVPAAFGGGGTHIADHAPDPIVRGVRHVETGDVHARVNQSRQHLR